MAIQNKERKKFFARDKIMAISIMAILLLSMAGALAFAPSTKAALAAPVVTTHYSFSYVSVGSNVVGVGQQILLVLWTADMPADIGETDLLIASSENRAAWAGQQFNITDPDGNSTIITLGASDPVGGGYYAYTPTKLGTYTVQSIFHAVWRNSTIITLANGTQQLGPHEIGYNVNPSLSAPHDDYYSDAVSNPATFVCQQNPVTTWTESPLPNDYWTRPINNAARDWSALPGNWLGGAWQQPAGEAGGTTSRFVYGLGTETSHILWTYPDYVGGYADARFGDIGYMTGHYQGLEFTAIILNGRIYYYDRSDAYTQAGSATAVGGYAMLNVLDLYTGELLGQYNNTIIPSYGQIYQYNSPNQHGAYSMLWRSVTSGAGTVWGTGNGTVLEMLDGYTLPLRHICYIANTSASGTNVVGNNGELLWYALNTTATADNQYRLTCWNNTNIIGETATAPNTGTTYWQWRPEGAGFGGGPLYSNALVFDGKTGFSINATIPAPLGPRNSILNQTATILDVRVGTDNAPYTGFSDNVGGYVILGTSGQNNELGNVQGQLWCLSLDRGQEGKQLWTSTFTAPYTPIAQNETASLVGVYPNEGVIVFHNTKENKYYGYDMKTGTALWTTAPEPDLNYYSMQTNYYQGNFLTSGYGGVVIAYNLITGQQNWNFTALNEGFESPYGNYPINIFAICDGKIYTLSGEHSVTNPLWRGPNIRCINATTGTEIWNLLGMGADNGAHLTGQYMQMADGKVVGLNYMDNELYCIGPGPSGTTVSAPQTISALGSSVMITGTVTDQTTTGRRNDNYNFDFTLQGTPAISDASMGRWMEYLYENQAKPTNATGVPVTLTAIDPNGNIINVGTTTSDINGNYGVVFKPDVPGTYQILASFAGSKAYGPSQDSTYLAVGVGPTTTPAPTAAPSSVADMYLIPATIGIIVAIAIATIVIVLALRKRP